MSAVDSRAAPVFRARRGFAGSCQRNGAQENDGPLLQRARLYAIYWTRPRTRVDGKFLCRCLGI